MRRERIADRWLDGIVVGLVVLIMGLAATAPRAASEPAAPAVTLVPLPPAACEAATPSRQRGCLLVAQAIVLRP
jgi:hypothetical protein